MGNGVCGHCINLFVILYNKCFIYNYLYFILQISLFCNSFEQLRGGHKSTQLFFYISYMNRLAVVKLFQFCRRGVCIYSAQLWRKSVVSRTSLLFWELSAEVTVRSSTDFGPTYPEQHCRLWFNIKWAGFLYLGPFDIRARGFFFFFTLLDKHSFTAFFKFAFLFTLLTRCTGSMLPRHL